MLSASDNPTDRRLFEAHLEDMVDAIHRDDLSGMGAAQLRTKFRGFDKAPLDDIVSITFPVDPRIKDKVQSEVKLTSSALPLVVNDTVLGYINYFNGRGTGRSKPAWSGRASIRRWFRRFWRKKAFRRN